MVYRKDDHVSALPLCGFVASCESFLKIGIVPRPPSPLKARKCRPKPVTHLCSADQFPYCLRFSKEHPCPPSAVSLSLSPPRPRSSPPAPRSPSPRPSRRPRPQSSASSRGGQQGVRTGSAQRAPY